LEILEHIELIVQFSGKVHDMKYISKLFALILYLLFICFDLFAQFEIYPGLTRYENEDAGMVLAIDHNKNIWGKSGSGGVYKFDGSIWTNYNPQNSEIPFEWIASLGVKSNGDMWLFNVNLNSGDRALVEFDGENWTKYDSSNTPLPKNGDGVLEDIMHITFDSQDNLWCIINYNGLFKYDGDDWYHYDYFDNQTGWGTHIYAIHIDQNDLIWLLISGFGLVKFYGDSTWTVCDSLDNAAGFGSDLETDLTGNVWWSGGRILYKYDGSKIESWDIAHTCGINEGIQVIETDSEGNVYIGTHRGIIKYNGTDWIPYTWSNVSNTISNLIIDRDNYKWFTSDELYNLDDTPQIKLHSPNGGQEIKNGDHIYIFWDVFYLSNADSKVEYTTNNGESWITIADRLYIQMLGTLPVNAEYYWQVPLVVPFSNQCRVRVSNADYPSFFDASDSNFTMYAQITAPLFNRTPGYFSSPIQVTISCGTAGVQIYYTTDGSEPTTNSQLFSTPILIDRNTEIKAKAFKSGWVESVTKSAMYEIEPAKIYVNFDTDGIWYDSDYNGMESRTINGGSSTITYGDIVLYEWSMNNTIISTDSTVTVELPTGTTYITLTLTSNLGKTLSDSLPVSVYAADLNTNGSILSAVSQLDENLFFISSTDDKIYSFDSTGSTKWVILTGGDIQSTICVSSENDIYVGSSDTRLYSFNYLGFPKWDKPMGGVIVSSPSVGPDSTIYVGITSGRLFAISRDGTILWGLQTGGEITSSASIDKRGVIYFGSADGKIYAVENTGDTLWTYMTGDTITSSPAIGVDSTIVIGSGDGYLYKLDENGDLVWKFNTGGSIHSSPVIGINGEIIVGSTSGNVYKIDKDGNELWKYDTGIAANGTAAIRADGTIYAGLDDGKIIVLSNTGELSWFLKTDGPVLAPPLITQNNLILIGSTDEKVYILKDNASTQNKVSSITKLEWPTFKGNNRRTGNKSDMYLSVSNKNINLPQEFLLSQNYPNPFNPSTTITFTLQKPEYTELKVFNILGEEVKILISTDLPAGEHHYQFNGTGLASGIYYYQIVAGEYREVKKMILLR
jgi:hypothetical protein